MRERLLRPSDHLRRITLPALSPQPAVRSSPNSWTPGPEPRWGRASSTSSAAIPSTRSSTFGCCSMATSWSLRRTAFALAPGTDLPVPETLQAVLAARLDTLPRGHKALLCDASVVGETFWLGAVAELATQDASAVGAAMDALIDRDLVRRVRTPRWRVRRSISSGTH